MNNRQTSKTGLFLMELMMAILFFCLASAVCVQMFVKGHTLSQRSVDLNHAVVRCESLAEAFYSCDANMQHVLRLFDNADYNFESDIITIDYLDSLIVTGKLEKNGEIFTLNISCVNKDTKEEVFSIAPSIFKNHKGGSYEKKKILWN